MERKRSNNVNGEKKQQQKQLGFCHRLFNLLINTLAFPTVKKVTLGPKRQEKTKSFGASDDKVGFNQTNYIYDDEEDDEEVSLVPPIIAIPVEEKLEGSKTGKRRGAVVRITGGSSHLEEYMSNVKAMNNKFKDREMKNAVSLGLARREGEKRASEVETGKPIERSMSNIDKKVEDFIREKKESFGKIPASLE